MTTVDNHLVVWQTDGLIPITKCFLKDSGVRIVILANCIQGMWVSNSFKWSIKNVPLQKAENNGDPLVLKIFWNNFHINSNLLIHLYSTWGRNISGTDYKFCCTFINLAPRICMMQQRQCKTVQNSTQLPIQISVHHSWNIHFPFSVSVPSPQELNHFFLS